MKQFRDRLEKALEIRKMSIAELSRKSGINKGTISHYLKGAYEPKQTAIYNMALALNVSPSWLLGLDVTMDGQHLAIDLDNLSDENKTRLFAYYQALIDIQGETK